MKDNKKAIVRVTITLRKRTLSYTDGYAAVEALNCYICCELELTVLTL